MRGDSGVLVAARDGDCGRGVRLSSDLGTNGIIFESFVPGIESEAGLPKGFPSPRGFRSWFDRLTTNGINVFRRSS